MEGADAIAAICANFKHFNKLAYEQAKIQIQKEFDNTIEPLKQKLEKKFESDLCRALEASLQSEEISSFTPVKPKSNKLKYITKTINVSVKVMGYILKNTTVNRSDKKCH